MSSNSNGMTTKNPNYNVTKNSGNKSKLNIFSIVMVCLLIAIVIFFFYSTYNGYVSYFKYSPYLIDGITDGSVAQKFSSYQIPPPSDSQYGTEMTYSFWIFIKDTNFSSNGGQCSSESGQTGTLSHIFHKGSYDYITSSGQSDGLSSVSYPLLQSPGVWLYPNTNKLNIRFNTYDNVVETADVGNIPLNMWVCVVIVLVGVSVDVYINGNLKKRVKLEGVPKFNYGDLYTSNWGGFQGYLSRLRYFNTAIQPFMIDQIFNMGPSQNFASNITSALTDPSAKLSSSYWMTTGYPNSMGIPGYNQSSQSTG